MARQASPGFIPDRGSYRANFSLPAGITVEGATPKRGGVNGGPKGGPLTPPRCRTSGLKRGGRSLHFLPLPCGAPGEARTRRAPPRHG